MAFFRRILPPALLAVAISFSSALAQSAAPAVPALPDAVPVRDHILFMGLQVMVEVDRTLCPVVAANQSVVEVTKDGRRVRIPHDSVQFRTSAEPTVSRASVGIVDVETERCFSIATDPARDAAQQQMVMMTADAQAQEVAARELSGAIVAADSINNAVADGQLVPPGEVAKADANVQLASTRFSQVYGTPQFSSAIPGKKLSKTDEQDAPFDTFEIRFKVSSPEPVDDAYAVLRMVVRDPRQAGAPANALKFFKLPKLGPKERKITLSQSGLPPGFAVDRYEVHVYSTGHELATSLSTNRVDLDADEAQKFFVMRHVMNHRSDSLPIQLITELLPDDIADRLPAAQKSRSVEVEVDADGHILSVVLDSASPSDRDAVIAAIVRELYFLPAVMNGTPVRSTSTFALSEFLP